MKHDFPQDEVERIIGLFPAKYQRSLKTAMICKGRSKRSWEFWFTKHQDMYDFLLLWDKNDFPSEKFPDEFSLGIYAKCPHCGNLQMNGGMDWALIELNSRQLKEVIKNNGKIWDSCILCLCKHMPGEQMGEYCRETGRTVKAIRGQWEEEKDSVEIIH
ncbi:MAG: hypothetical protein NTZ49_04980 [Candidatus Parcubacteria bacterium]|nr:hypothetical protein [Candidatus Parcubacteria bacterium]